MDLPTGSPPHPAPRASALNTTTATVNIVDGNTDPITSDFNVTFSSDCVSDGTATLTEEVATVGGQATAEYIAQGCVGADEIRATVVFNNETFSAVGTVVVEQDDVGSIEFVSAAPAQIALSGTGGIETSTVTFRVVGATGAPIQGVTVDFSLNATTGGLSLSETSADTDNDGVARTIVSAGTVATSVRVTATETVTGVSTQSSQLVVSTGIPDTNSFSLSNNDHFNPEGFNFDGEEIRLTIRAADAFNNPVPDGTTISFYTEGGSIDPSCSTANAGACTVTWRSQDPRPANGLVTILATAIGNESFTDNNGNGRFNDGETFEDIGEAFADENEDGDYDVGEFFIDFGPGGIPDGQRNGPDGLYNGVLCADASQTECSISDQSITVSESLVIVMSRSGASDDILYQGGVPIPVFGSIDLDEAVPESFTVRLADSAENALPFGTTATFTVTDGYTLDGTTSATFDDRIGPGFFASPLRVEQDDDMVTSGTLTIEIQTPNNVVTSYFWNLF